MFTVLTVEKRKGVVIIVESIKSQVLVIDDDLEVRRIISSLLQRVGIQAILVKDGPTALTLLGEGLVPSLIILDLMMPGMDGFEVLGRIRQMPAMDEVPVLILSARVEPETIRHGLEAGADAYVTKIYIAHNLIDRARILIAAGRQPQPQTRMVQRTTPLGGRAQPAVDGPKVEAPRDNSDGSAEPDPNQK